jgi:hypothetical protein
VSGLPPDAGFVAMISVSARKRANSTCERAQGAIMERADRCCATLTGE